MTKPKKKPARRKKEEPLLWAWRVVRPDFRSRGDFRWPFPGNWAEASGPFTNGAPCPSQEGDGVCLAKTWAGAASGDIPARTVLVCGYFANDVLGENEDKIRVRRAFVSEVWDGERLVRELGRGADLSGATCAERTCAERHPGKKEHYS